MTPTSMVLLNLALGITVFVLWRAWMDSYESAAVDGHVGRAPADSFDARAPHDIATPGGRLLHDLQHDVGNIFHEVACAVATARSARGRDVRTKLVEAERTVESAHEALARLFAHDPPAKAPAAASTIFGIYVKLARAEAPVSLVVENDFEITGDRTDAGALMQNLLTNATREARLAGGTVNVVVSRRVCRVSNRVRDPSTLRPEMWERGVSYSGSTGCGLAIVSEAAARLGWKVRHDVVGHYVTFSVFVS